MKSYSSITFFFLLLHTAAYSQFSDFRLDQYKLPDIKTSRLDFYMNYQEGSTKRSSNGNSSENLYKSRANSGAMSMYYDYFRNKEKYQGNTGISVSGEFNKNNQNTESAYNNSYINNTASSISSYSRNQFSFEIVSENRFYRNKNFLEVSPGLSLSNLGYEQHNQSQGTFSNYINKRNSLTGNLTVAGGHGRIEPVHDLRLAIYILEELSKAGRLKKTPPDETVINMAKVISKITRERFFDSRLRKIRELQVIDSFMLANDLLTLNDINYFAILNDEWDYAWGPSRSAGFAISGGVDNNLSFTRERDEEYGSYPDPSDIKRYENMINTEVFAKVQYHKPLNLHWQMAAVFRSSYGFIKVSDPLNSENVSGNMVSGIFRSNVDYTMQYLPNSRTSVSLSLNGILTDTNGKSTINSENGQYRREDATVDLMSSLEAYFYISPRLRAQLRWSYDFGNVNQLQRTNSTDNQFKNRLTEQHLYFSISYSLF